MKRILLLLSLVLSFSVTSYAQRGKAKKDEPEITPEEAIANYDFHIAAELLEEKIEKLKKRKKPTTEEDILLEEANKGIINLSATERVTIIDSLILKKKDLFNILKLSDECGEIKTNTSNDKILYDSCGTSFLNQLQNKMIIAQRNNDGLFRLFEKTLNGKDWGAEKPLKGLSPETEENQNYPFMLTDGITLYFAADKEEGMGGYDIYMTRYDADERIFLSPENLGMPFNSPANDYLMVFDEYYNLGWFVTDRYQTGDTICLYTFLPNEVRRVYNEDEIGIEQLKSFARINSIKDTWTDMEAVKNAQKRLYELRQGKSQQVKVHDFEFVINDALTYYTLNDFKNPNAKQKAQWWQESTKDLKKNKEHLEVLRSQYASSSADKKNQLAPQIRITESKVEELERDVKLQEKEIRKIELGK